MRPGACGRRCRGAVVGWRDARGARPVVAGAGRAAVGRRRRAARHRAQPGPAHRPAAPVRRARRRAGDAAPRHAHPGHAAAPGPRRRPAGVPRARPLRTRSRAPRRHPSCGRGPCPPSPWTRRSSTTRRRSCATARPSRTCGPSSRSRTTSPAAATCCRPWSGPAPARAPAGGPSCRASTRPRSRRSSPRCRRSPGPSAAGTANRPRRPGRARRGRARRPGRRRRPRSARPRRCRAPRAARRAPSTPGWPRSPPPTTGCPRARRLGPLAEAAAGLGRRRHRAARRRPRLFPARRGPAPCPRNRTTPATARAGGWSSSCSPAADPSLLVAAPTQVVGRLARREPRC